MKQFLTASVFTLSLLAWSAAAEDMTGVITDAKCKHTDTSAKSAECARKCIQAGEKAVFINTADNKVYTIANPDKVQEHIGQRVTVTGNVSGDDLTVDSIKAARGRRAKQG